MKNIGILGIGAIGSLLTKYLISNQTNNYFYYNRSNRDKVRIEFQGRYDDIPIKIATQHSQKLDWLIVCLKEYHFQNAIPTLNELIGLNTKVAIFQNGINLANRYNQFSNPSNLLETIIDCPIQRIKANELKQLKIPHIILPDNENAEEFIKLFKEPVIEFTKSNNFNELQWIKLIESSSIGSIQAITEMPCSVFQNSEKLNEFQMLVSEGIEVAKSEGIKINQGLNRQLLTKLKNYPRSKGSSMLSDKLLGNELELNAKIGVIVKIAERNKINVPTSKRVYNSLVN
jgi:2-dehydropantoate 2-reductase